MAAALGMPMPSSSTSIRPVSPTSLQPPQAMPQNFSPSNPPSQGVSGLSLALPLAAPQTSSTAMSSTLATVSTAPSSSQGGSALAYPFGGASMVPPPGLPKIKVADILPEDGAPSPTYQRAVDGLSNSLARHSAVVLELNTEDAALVRCALESSKLYFRTRAQSPSGGQQSWGGAAWSKTIGYVPLPTRDVYYYRAGRHLEGEEEQPPPCMSDVFRCLGKASRVVLAAIARYLRLRSDAFNSLLDDCPLPNSEISSSVLVATHFHMSGPSPKGPFGGEAHTFQESEKGLLMLIATDTPGLQVCDPSGQWYVADNGLHAGDLVLLTGRALNHATAALRRACTYRMLNMSPSVFPGSATKTSLIFRLMPRSNATLDGSLMANSGHVIPEGYGPVTVAQFMEGLTAAEDLLGNGSESTLESRGIPSLEPSLRSVLSDPLTGELLEDACTAPGCGHSFGRATLRRVSEAHACSTCGAVVELDRLIPNFALRAAASVFKREEYRRRLQNANRKRRKELAEQGDMNKRLKDSLVSPMKGVQYPFSVNETVLIKGNKRTPEKFVGREAIITSQCLNGWYLLRTLDNGESVRLQYRSLEKHVPHHSSGNEECIQPQHPSQLNS